MLRTSPIKALLWLCCAWFCATGPVLAAGDPAGPPANVIPLLGERDARSVPVLRVMDEDDAGLTVEFELPAIEAAELEVGGTAYDVLAIEGGGFEGDAGEPELPTFSRLIQIPDRSGVRVTVTSLETRELEGIRPMPHQPDDAEGFVLDAAAYGRSGYEPAERVRIGEPALARDLRVVPVTFRPVRFDPSRNTVEVAARLRVRIDFTGEDLRNTPERHLARLAPSFDRLYRELVLNYAGPRDDEQISLGTYVIICPNNSSVISALAPLVEWRTRKGFDVHLVTTAETGSTTTSIKAWLQNAYDTWENPPEYITLVGDESGTVAIPCWYESYSGYSGETDHNYTQLAGGDILADAHIGRISVDSVNTLTLFVNRMVGYESTPYMTDTSWYERACLLGDPSYSGYTCVQIMQWHKQRLIEWGYTDVDTIFTAPFSSQFTSCINQGDTVFSYRGYYGMSNITTGTITSLNNGWKMPYAVNITCGTGDFAGNYAVSESWIRAGTYPNSPKGGIASVGSSTIHTDTRHNNCITYGIWRGIFWEDMFTFGESLTRGKYELYVNYALTDYTRMCYFTSWNNLMGDAAGEIWTGVPQTVAVTHPSQIALGTSAVSVSVTAGGSPCAGAWVCLWKNGEIFVGGATNALGTVELPITTPNTGTLQVTVSKHDHKPYLGSITISQATNFVGYLAHTIDDDASGTSLGNNDDLISPPERIELPVQLENFGTQSASNVTATLSCSDPYVTILDNSETFGTIAAGATAWSADDFDIQISSQTPHGHLFLLDLDVTSGANTWRSAIPLTVASAELEYVSTTLYNVGSNFDPGESGQFAVRLRNAGGLSATTTTGSLTCDSPWITLTDASGSFGTIAIGGAGDNTGDRFALSASSGCFPGHQAPFTLILQFSSGATDTVRFTLPIGIPAATDPTGPDTYGYYAFDNTDTAYPEYAPVYSWIEIDPNQGGTGTSLGLTDFGDGQDDSKTVTLPFAFAFYGETFTQATICSNGWIAMGSTYLTNYRNWNIPGAGAPNYMIAPMWDDLYQSGNNKVYTKYDSANHRYIVQWSRLINNNGGATENIEAILYDPAYHQTDTGDGIIVFQYNQFTNCDGQQHYCTIGIQNGDQTDGLEYTYYNVYNPGASTVQAGRAIKFMPISLLPRGTLTGTVRNASNGGTPVPGASVTVIQTGDSFVTGESGVYAGMLPEGTYSVRASHPSFTSQTYYNVHIEVGETTTRDFSLQDVLAPVITGTTDYGNTQDETGPYAISTTISDFSSLTTRSLIYNAGGSGWVTVPLASQGGSVWSGSIPGQPVNSLVRYYILATDAAGLTGRDPAGAPTESYAFWILQPIVEDDMEIGAGGWEHYVVTGGFNDDWHLSDQRNHTAGGSHAWKFGDTGTGDYADLADGALESDLLSVSGDLTLSFWHWIEAEASGSYPGYAYDGGLLEASINGGPWTQVTPDGGYPYLVRIGSEAGPFAAETPIFSGTADWAQVQVTFADLDGTLRLRFRFGSDGNTGGEGWYIDDVILIGDEPDASAVQEVTLRPERLALHPNLPNPFGSAGTLLRFDLPQTAPVCLEVIDAGGRLVRTLAEGPLPAGRHSFRWNGLDAAGRAAGSGVYFYRLETGGRTMSERMLLVR